MQTFYIMQYLEQLPTKFPVSSGPVLDWTNKGLVLANIHSDQTHSNVKCLSDLKQHWKIPGCLFSPCTCITSTSNGWVITVMFDPCCKNQYRPDWAHLRLSGNLKIFPTVIFGCFQFPLCTFFTIEILVKDNIILHPQYVQTVKSAKGHSGTLSEWKEYK